MAAHPAQVDRDSLVARLREPRPGASDDPDFARRLAAHLPDLVDLLHQVYGHRDDFAAQVERIVEVARTSWAERSDDLKSLDARREDDADWFLSNRMLGGVCYVDRYAGDLDGVRAKIPYFQELGLTYLHLMPLFLAPEENSDGGYAVSSYRDVNPALGDMDQLRALADELRAAGISLVVDFIFNHTSNEHAWARKAAAGDPEFEGYYWVFPDREMPDAFERTTREIFPDDHPGSFVPMGDGRWIWATFYSFQWDLNYSNPAVFAAMAGEMLFLANVGVDFLRMDAVAFIWKQLGTACESLPEAHILIRAFNAMCRIAAPSLLFKSEAIVHPDEVVQYIDRGECQVSYNPLQMALTWEALATRDPRMLRQALERRHAIPAGTAWVNYVRSHDDIGWTFADEDAAEFGIDGFAHRRFLNDFYTGAFPGGFADGVPFQTNPETGDSRIAGTTASLCGLERGDDGAIARILLAHAIALSTGGIPLVFLGDEVGQLNDYRYLDDPSLAMDSRWVNRPLYPADRYAERHDVDTSAGRIWEGLHRLIAARAAEPAFAGGELIPFDAGDSRVLGYQRPGDGYRILVLANFADDSAVVPARVFGGFARADDLLVGGTVDITADLDLPAHGVRWIRVALEEG